MGQQHQLVSGRDLEFYYIRILSASAIHGVQYDVKYGTRWVQLILLYTFKGDATLTLGPYESAGTCIINYAPPEGII